FIDPNDERWTSITGERHHPRADGELPWGMLEGIDALYYTAGDDEALRLSCGARILVCTTRILQQLQRVGVQLDGVVESDRDESERYETADIEPVPHHAVLTRGKDGGRFSVDGSAWREFDSTPPPGPIVDTYGAGDSFAAGVAYGLATYDDPV